MQMQLTKTTEAYQCRFSGCRDIVAREECYELPDGSLSHYRNSRGVEHRVDPIGPRAFPTGISVVHLGGNDYEVIREIQSHWEFTVTYRVRVNDAISRIIDGKAVCADFDPQAEETYRTWPIEDFEEDDVETVLNAVREFNRCETSETA